MHTQSEGPAVEITHPEKVLFPEDGITKQELVEYYRKVAPVMIPLVRDRPLTLQRFPQGISKPGFFQKEAPQYLPEWIDTVQFDLRERGRMQRQILCNNVATLSYIANQDCITQHVWLSRAGRLEYPDRMIFDLDPPDDDFRAVKNTAMLIKDELASMEMTAFIMTTGSRGIHVIIPLDGSADFETVRAFARSFAEDLAKERPEDLTTVMSKEKRDGRLFIDYLRNAYGQTGVSPYTVRARPGAPVATPVAWDDLGDLKSSQQYNIRNLLKKLDRAGNPWKDIERYASAPGKIKK